MRTTRWRTWTGLTVAAALVLAVAGCNAVPKPLVGLTLDGSGKPVVVLRLCADGRGTLVGLHRAPVGAMSGPSYSPAPPVFLAQDVSDQAASTSLPLGAPSPAWQVDIGLDSALADGFEYALDVTAPKAPGMSLRFTLADLKGLGSVKIWTLRDTGSDGTAMSVADFEQRAAKSCQR
jgi:hypothetical protein